MNDYYIPIKTKEIPMSKYDYVKNLKEEEFRLLLL
jgi:hypothetical protein